MQIAGIGRRIKRAIPCTGNRRTKTHLPGATVTTHGGGGGGGGGGIGRKIKNAIPGMGRRRAKTHHTTGSTTTPGGGGFNQHGHAKKGVVQKIKEKLPGYHGY